MFRKKVFSILLLFPKLLKSFNDEAFPRLGRCVRVIQRSVLKDPKKVNDKSTLRDEHLSMRDVAFSTFKSVTELAAATILAKRVLVPFIATPLASKVEKWMNRNDKNESANADNNNPNPSMRGNQSKTDDSGEAATLDVISEADGNSNLIERYKQSLNA